MEVKTVELILRGKMKSGKNNMQIGRNGKHYPLASFQSWRNQMISQILKQLGYRVKLSGSRLHAVIHYWPGDLIRRDAPGIIDALFHVFEHAGLVDDDAKFKSVVWEEHELNRKDPVAMITIEEIK